MCTNAAETAYNLLLAEEPTIKAILTLEGVAGTTQAIAALAAYNSALTLLQSWVPGTTSQNIIQVLSDLQVIITALPIPPLYQLITDAVLAGIITVMGLVTGNSPAPAPVPAALPEGVTALMVQQDHERATMAEYSIKAQALVPFYKIQTRATWLPERHPDAQYRACVNKAVEVSGAPASFRL